MKKRQLAAQIALIILFCAVALVLIYLPFLLKRPVEDEAFDSIKLTTQGVQQVLSTIKDPELDFTIVELGLVREIEINQRGKVIITIIFTSPACPLSDFIVSQVERKVKTVKGVQEVEVKIDQTVLWDWSMMSEEGKRKFLEYMQ